MRRCIAFLMVAAATGAAAEIRALPEYLRTSPEGTILACDRSVGSKGFLDAVAATAPRGGYYSFQVVVTTAQPAPYSLTLKLSAPLEADVFREWFHFSDHDKRWSPDALVPVTMPYRSNLPEADNKIEKQTAQAFWVDVWIPRDVKPGQYKGSVMAEVAGARKALPITLTVLSATFPEEDAVTLDHNSYGSSWIAQDYPAARAREGTRFFESDTFFKLIHAYHRIFYEHRGTYHQLGYGHGGKTGPEFAPALEGSGRTRRIRDWNLFDRHYGPLFDGSAFEKTRRGPRPIPSVYLPVNPDWPASFLWWGEPGYETEFVNVLSEMERHFREKKWTRTNFELFFNHKKRYRAYPWDGDETRFDNDLPYFFEYSRMMKKAVPADSPVKFVFRADASWLMEREFREMAGVVNFWVSGSGMLSWFPESVRMLKDRGDIVWHYSGPPEVNKVSSSITLFAAKAWMWGIDGYIHWQTIQAGDDPWFHFDGGGTALVYPGERFGIEGPIPSIRLKIQRNCAQDLALMERYAKAGSREKIRADLARLYNGTKPADWWDPRPKFADTPPINWTNADFEGAPRPHRREFTDLDAAAWQNVRNYLVQTASEEK